MKVYIKNNGAELIEITVMIANAWIILILWNMAYFVFRFSITTLRNSEILLPLMVNMCVLEHVLSTGADWMKTTRMEGRLVVGKSADVETYFEWPDGNEFYN